MWTARKIYCRIFQKIFRAALPFLPYRNPRIIPSVAGIGDVCKKKNIDSKEYRCLVIKTEKTPFALL